MVHDLVSWRQLSDKTQFKMHSPDNRETNWGNDLKSFICLVFIVLVYVKVDSKFYCSIHVYPLFFCYSFP